MMGVKKREDVMYSRAKRYIVVLVWVSVILQWAVLSV
jgi:hypothetical protein